MFLKQIIQLSVSFFNNLLAFLLVKRVIKFIHEFLYKALFSVDKRDPKMLTHIGSESLRFTPKYIAFIQGRRFFIFAI